MASNQVYTSTKLHVWRVLSMLAALIAIIVGLIVIATGAA